MISVTISRTIPAVAAAPTRAAAKPVKLGRLGRMFPIAREIAEATSHARRAAILLRLPDAIVLSHGDALATACRSCDFAMGVMFLTQRSAVLHVRRGADGKVPEHFTQTLEIWLRGMTALANRENDE